MLPVKSGSVIRFPATPLTDMSAPIPPSFKVLTLTVSESRLPGSDTSTSASMRSTFTVLSYTAPQRGIFMLSPMYGMLSVIGLNGFLSSPATEISISLSILPIPLRICSGSRAIAAPGANGPMPNVSSVMANGSVKSSVVFHSDLIRPPDGVPISSPKSLSDSNIGMSLFHFTAPPRSIVTGRATSA